MFIQIPVSKIEYPVARITDVVGPTGLHSSAERILVCEFVGDQVAIYDHNLKRVATVGGGPRFLVKKIERTDGSNYRQSVKHIYYYN